MSKYAQALTLFIKRYIDTSIQKQAYFVSMGYFERKIDAIQRF